MLRFFPRTLACCPLCFFLFFAFAAGAAAKPSPAELKRKLTPLQFNVTQEDGTEPPFKNEYWDKKDDGIYVDIVSGEALFSSRDKYDSGTGWPSFTKPLHSDAVITREQAGAFGPQTEVRSRRADSHLGHVFKDGPPPAGRRFCMNSAALRFVALKDLEAAGLGEYRSLFARPAPVVATPTPIAKATPIVTETATFAGGCFWSVEKAFEGMDGVRSVTAGFTGGKTVRPSYDEVSKGGTGHAEAVEIVFDPKVVSYRELLAVFFKETDPTDTGGQFCDRGSQYRNEIFFHSEAQRLAAEKEKISVAKDLLITAKIQTAVSKAGAFYPAEEAHQDYAAKNPVRYKFYASGCGRGKRLSHVWGKLSDEVGF